MPVASVIPDIQRRILAAGIAGLALAVLAYFPGLSGTFLFDDFANLPALGAYGPVDDLDTFWLYVTSGGADPTGRPLALASFLLDAHDWPADPLPFKRTNLLIHLFNGILLFDLLRRLGGALGESEPPRRTAAALLGASLWLLHPLFVSTTLYVVQREAMLAATFTLIGLIGAVAGWQRDLGRGSHGALLFAVSILACTVLAVLSKANGALLPLLAGLLCLTVLQNPKAPSRPMQWAIRLCVLLPAILILAYLGKIAFDGLGHGVLPLRGWSLEQRLWTQPEIIWRYLGLLFWPRPYTTGLFNDHLEVANGLLDPPTTIPAILGLLAMAGWAVAARRRHPAAALAILFFLAGHLMESSVIALELYYEHRNYLPSMVLFWPLARLLVDSTNVVFTKSRMLATLRPGLLPVLPLLLAGITAIRADLWGNPFDQAMVWARLAPHSARAQVHASIREIEAGKPAAARDRLHQAAREQPNEAQVLMLLANVECMMSGAISGTMMRDVEHSLRTALKPGPETHAWLSALIDGSGPCGKVREVSIESLLDAYAANAEVRRLQGRRHDLHDLRARQSLGSGNATRARQLYAQALQADPSASAGFAQVAMIASHGHSCEALAHLAAIRPLAEQRPTGGWHMATLHRWLLWKRRYWPNEWTRLHDTLATECPAQPA
jgi:tetratricopeptide (TPR) repeat protein